MSKNEEEAEEDVLMIRGPFCTWGTETVRNGAVVVVAAANAAVRAAAATLPWFRAEARETSRHSMMYQQQG